ncbi:MAG TPA: enoyl-CoA hydratase-related protein [Sphingomicrobium sp.]|jgi:3-hydroxyacyl-CoA dehydrogenase/enoyl-CoA hydratase/3-hydroxybutyryl-CoA epimerase|nr:enoyl-CoA hydratase-related protein [Sphingomicrobium sp.]
MSEANILPNLREFRVEQRAKGIVHLVFDSPGRSMNVFNNAAIHELGAFAIWLRTASIRGVVVRSGKSSAFCVGADLTELGTAYDMIMAAAPAERSRLAFDHFSPFSRATRALETAGKPVAAAISRLALGGGCELALGAHHRVLADHPRAALGLPESLVGLLPGSGGTQRLPRLIGLESALPVLLNGARLGGAAALSSGLVDELVPEGEEVAAAEQWILQADEAVQAWDRPDWKPPAAAAIGERVAQARKEVLAETLGHYPAPLAILDCLEQGLPKPIEQALRAELEIFSRLIQRPEPRNMIRTLFLGRIADERGSRNGPDPAVEATVARLLEVEAGDPSGLESLAAAGFRTGADAPPAQTEIGSTYWIDSADPDPRKQRVKDHIARLASVASVHRLSQEQQRIVEYRLAMAGAYPPYLPSLFSDS